ncbi:MAG: lipopolysaccharide heptosyltransferase II [Betaproteobacteria bacterium]|nr:lipopolysaccharide heptosyltransferase II [Betaproteobacteria bacterium]
MAQPLAGLLHARGERVTALALPGVADVLRATPGISEVVQTGFAHGRLDLRERMRLAARLRGQGFERAYVLGNNVKSRLVPWLARVPVRIGWRGEAAGALLTHALEREPGARRGDMRGHYARLAGPVAARSAGAADLVGDDSPAWREPAEPVLSAAPERAAQAAAEFGLQQDFIALCPGAEYGPAKQWPAPHYAALAGMAYAAGWRVVILGAARDQAFAQSVVREAGGEARVLDLSGRTSMAQALALLGAAGGVVSNDSGLMHVAAALGRPTVGIYGSTDPRHTPPAAHRSTTLWLQLPCSPCFRRECPLGHTNCLRALDPEWAWSALRQRMHAADAGSADREDSGTPR